MLDMEALETPSKALRSLVVPEVAAHVLQLHLCSQLLVTSEVIGKNSHISP